MLSNVPASFRIVQSDERPTPRIARRRVGGLASVSKRQRQIRRTAKRDPDVRIRHNYAKARAGRSSGWGRGGWSAEGMFGFESAEIKTPRTAGTNCWIYGSVAGRETVGSTPVYRQNLRSFREGGEEGERGGRKRGGGQEYKMSTFPSAAEV
ncbi:hypothetical protein KM043_007205 [Ampulex compressa]|nr:hypothetical protein KM043_007205 [Ampulex compressa]